MIWTLIPVSLIYGVAAAIVLRRFSDRAAVRGSINRMIAHLYEFRLFIGTPSLIFRAQFELLRENLRLLRLLILPCAILAAVFVALYPRLDAIYGYAPLKPGESTVVTTRVEGDAVLEAPPGIAIETPGVRSIHDHEVSWRVRALVNTPGDFKVRSSGRVIQIRYPRRTILGANWMVSFFLISGAAALVYRR